MSLYGVDALSNVVPCCYPCNNAKKDRWPDIDGCEHCMEIVDAYLKMPGYLQWAIDYIERRVRLYHKSSDAENQKRMKRMTP